MLKGEGRDCHCGGSHTGHSYPNADHHSNSNTNAVSDTAVSSGLSVDEGDDGSQY